MCTKYCCKSLNKQSSGVQERINPFYINSYGQNSFGLWTTFRNELSSWTEVWLYWHFQMFQSSNQLMYLRWDFFATCVISYCHKYASKLLSAQLCLYYGILTTYFNYYTLLQVNLKFWLMIYSPLRKTHGVGAPNTKPSLINGCVVCLNNIF